MPAHGPGTTRGRGSGGRPTATGRTAGTDPRTGEDSCHLGHRAAPERSQWALELWKATEEKRAALVALKQSEETLHQVWRQMQPHWPGPPIAVLPTTPGVKGRQVAHQRGAGKLKCGSCCEQAGGRVATSLLAGGATGASKPPDEPPAKGETSRPGGQGWSPNKRGALAESGHRMGGRPE